MADAKPDDIKDLLGGALFKALYKWMEETGPVYLLPTGASGSACSMLPKKDVHASCMPPETHIFQTCKYALLMHRELQSAFSSEQQERCNAEKSLQLNESFLTYPGPVSSFLVVSDPEAAKHVLRATDNPKRPIYVKGLVAEVHIKTATNYFHMHETVLEEVVETALQRSNCLQSMRLPSVADVPSLL